MVRLSDSILAVPCQECHVHSKTCHVNCAAYQNYTVAREKERNELLKKRRYYAQLDRIGKRKYRY